MTLLIASIVLSGATITLPIEAESQGTEIELGEIATITTDDPVLEQRLAGLELGYAPAPGYSRLLDVAAIERAIRTQAPDVQVIFAGKPACRVRPEVARIDSEQLVGTARTALSELLQGRDATIELRDAVRGVAIPAGTAGHRLRARIQNRELLSGTFSVPVEILVDGGVYRTIWTAWQVDLFETMPVVARPIPAGTTLSVEHFERRRVRVEPGARARALPVERVLGSIASRDLREGESLTRLDVQRPTVVQGGTTIFLEVKKGAVRARVAAVALQSGAVGDRIRVQNASSGQELFAVIKSRDLVVIDMGS